MYSFDYLDQIWDSIENKIYIERLQYLHFYEKIEEYISKFCECAPNSNRSISIMIGGAMGINLLLGKERSIEDFAYELYTENAFVHANDLVNELESVNKDEYIIFLKTTIPNIKYQIMINNRFLVTIFKLSEGSYDLILPVTVKNFNKKNDILVISPEIQLIDIYRTLYSPNQTDEWENTLYNETKLFKHLKQRIQQESELGGIEIENGYNHEKNEQIKRNDEIGDVTKRSDKIGNVTKINDEIGNVTKRSDEIGNVTKINDEIGNKAEIDDVIKINNKIGDVTKTKINNEIGNVTTKINNKIGNKAEIGDETKNKIKIKNEIKNIEQNIDGGSESISLEDRKNIELQILQQFVLNNNVVLIGEHALKIIIKSEMSSHTVQVLSQNDIENDFMEIQKIIRNTLKRQIPIFKLTRELYIMKDFRIRRTTIKIGDVEMGQKEVIYIYNSAHYDLIPFNILQNDSNGKLQLGNPFVLLRFLLIDFWTIRWVKKMGSIDEFFAKQRLESIIDKLLELRVKMQSENKSVSKKKTKNIDINIQSTQSLKIFQSSKEEYIGFYDDENISQKMIIKDLTKKFYDYYPSEYKRKNGEYRKI